VPGSTFVVGVQWHPEHPDRRLADRPLVDAFLAATN
jgi:gamma-glutamyl-gamma-aminobutyrate hydrolase PuuD